MTDAPTPQEPFTHDNLLEKLRVAADLLATGEGSLQGRLFSAYLSALCMLQERDAPPDLWPRLESILQRLTSAGRVGESPNDEIALLDDDAEQLKSEIRRLHGEVKRRRDKWRPL